MIFLSFTPDGNQTHNYDGRARGPIAQEQEAFTKDRNYFS